MVTRFRPGDPARYWQRTPTTRNSPGASRSRAPMNGLPRTPPVAALSWAGTGTCRNPRRWRMRACPARSEPRSIPVRHCTSNARYSRASAARCSSCSDRATTATMCDNSSPSRPSGGRASCAGQCSNVMDGIGRRHIEHRTTSSMRDQPVVAVPTVSCQLWTRSGYYQPGGAFGFRNQLQDVMALLLSRPDMAREHILRAAGRRSRKVTSSIGGTSPRAGASELAAPTPSAVAPYVVGEYVRTTGDSGVLDERVPSSKAPCSQPASRRRTDRRGLLRRTARCSTLPARDRARHYGRRARTAALRFVRLERRHEPRGTGRTRREHLARVLPAHRADKLRTAVRSPRRAGESGPLPGGGEAARLRPRTGVGWGMVSPRVLRRRVGAGLGAG